MSHLVIRLGETTVGDLRHRSGDSWEFRFRADYVSLRPRPVLGQSFEDDLERIHRENLRLPPFFSNLLPEGPLRRLVAREAAVNEQREALLLEFLGRDLPGAVVIAKGDDLGEEGEYEPPVSSAEAAESGSHLKFSLAGVQLKFSVLRAGDRLTLPATGLGGNWIVKLPDAQYSGVPANEISMLRWARLADIEVPDHELVPISEIGGLPQGLRFTERDALAIRRFDRAASGRIHQEDFAQVLELFPSQKYEKYNYETIANVIHAVAGPEALLEYARRLAFVVLSGNGDAHHKNWSLLYLDGRRASLAPAYDLVFTRAYLEEDNLALNLRRSKSFRDVTLESFRHLAQKTGFDESRLTEAVAEVVQRIRQAWKMYEPEMPMGKGDKARLRRHLDSIRL